MKKILITGKNSYIGTSFTEWISRYPGKYEVNSISVRDNCWKKKSFAEYDVILHTAAIVHVKNNNLKEYFIVNRDLTIELAEKAKSEGVKQFIFLSTMGVYGQHTGYISESTIPSPTTLYAKSKYEAEQYLLKLTSMDFKVVILRPPLVYGRGCPGNYSRLSNLAKKVPIFPEILNERSMIYIDNLTEFIRLTIDHSLDGVFFPQNKEYVNSTDLVKIIASHHGKQLKTSRAFNRLIFICQRFSSTFRRVFGTFIYDKNLLGSPKNFFVNNTLLDYNVVSFSETIERTEKPLSSENEH